MQPAACTGYAGEKRIAIDSDRLMMLSEYSIRYTRYVICRFWYDMYADSCWYMYLHIWSYLYVVIIKCLLHWLCELPNWTRVEMFLSIQDFFKGCILSCDSVSWSSITQIHPPLSPMCTTTTKTKIKPSYSYRLETLKIKQCQGYLSGTRWNWFKHVKLTNRCRFLHLSLQETIGIGGIVVPTQIHPTRQVRPAGPTPQNVHVQPPAGSSTNLRQHVNLKPC